MASPPPPPALPTPRAFLTALVSALAAPAGASANPLRPLAPNARSPLLTLHVLFPDELLPALDLLDRGLVTRLRVRAGDAPATAPAPRHDTTTSRDAAAAGAPPATAPSPAPASPARPAVYHVRSAQQRPSRYAAAAGRSHDPTATSYEVRLGAWNCSCPAFAFAAFPAPAPGDGGAGDDGDGDGDGDGGGVEVGRTGGSVGGGLERDGWEFGGAGRGEGTAPVCKHLLACVLVERSRLFAGFVEEREVGVEEAAGWAAGWGG